MKSPNEHRGRYNAPIIAEVAALLIDEDKGPRDIVFNSRDGRLQRVSEMHRSYNPLQHPLPFPFGNYGYCINITQQNTVVINDSNIDASNISQHVILQSSFTCIFKM